MDNTLRMLCNIFYFPISHSAECILENFNLRCSVISQSIRYKNYLPLDSAEFYYSVSALPGYPSPQLYVYNRYNSSKILWDQYVISQNEIDKQLSANPLRQVPVTILEEADIYGSLSTS